MLDVANSAACHGVINGKITREDCALDWLPSNVFLVETEKP